MCITSYHSKAGQHITSYTCNPVCVVRTVCSQHLSNIQHTVLTEVTMLWIMPLELNHFLPGRLTSFDFHPFLVTVFLSLPLHSLLKSTFSTDRLPLWLFPSPCWSRSETSQWKVNRAEHTGDASFLGPLAPGYWKDPGRNIPVLSRAIDSHSLLTCNNFREHAS